MYKSVLIMKIIGSTTVKYWNSVFKNIGRCFKLPHENEEIPLSGNRSFLYDNDTGQAIENTSASVKKLHMRKKIYLISFEGSKEPDKSNTQIRINK